MKTVAIIPAAGAGRRMGLETPKQYLSLAGIPILVHSLMAFHRSPFVDEIILAVPEGDVAEVRRDMVERYGLFKANRVIAGGRERQDSIRNALAHVRGGHGIILVHDGVRPFVSGPLIERVIAGAEEFGAVVPGIPVRDTVKAADPSGIVTRTVQREGLWLVQTPQAFRTEVITAAYERALAEGFYGTDDASLVERMGMPVRMIPGDVDNFKVTTPEDLARGERMAAGRTP